MTLEPKPTKSTGVGKGMATLILKNLAPEGPQSSMTVIKRYLVRLSDAHPRATARELLQKSRLDVGVSTLGHYLRSLQRRVFLTRRKPWIGPHNRRQRKRGCRLRCKWELSVWRKHCYTNEVYLQIATRTGYRRKV